ncbi:WecB/TagA/CpsF family glycosyltransferase [Ilumatobacter sp.]|uniref:WecB/TagA/CpsF family glycosyltransferase n=1 Tax=Ilumatobacter sp. TaxID=1967498 RepID=UPI003B522CEC
MQTTIDDDRRPTGGRWADEPEISERNSRVVRLLNVDIDDISMDDLLDLRHGTFITVHTDMMRLFQRDAEFHRMLDKYDLVTCDSQILAFAARLLGTPVRERVSGSDYFPRFYERYADDPTVRIFLCGAKPGVADRARDRINAKVGREIVVGTDSPAFGFEDDPAEVDRVIDKINASGATVLVVGLGAPKQDRFIHTYRSRMPDVELLMPLGGTIDYEAGEVRRPAPWVTDLGLEWVARILGDPKARWKRYLVEQPPVLLQLVKQRFGRYSDPWAR